MLASSHTSVLINHCSARLRMHTRATTFLDRLLLVGGGGGGEGGGQLRLGQLQITQETHRAPRSQYLCVHTQRAAHTWPTWREDEVGQRGDPNGASEASVFVPGGLRWQAGVREEVSARGVTVVFLVYRSQVSFVAISTS